MTAILDVRNLTKTYSHKNRQQTINALNGISFRVEAGQCLGLLGPNGAGKTTTLEIIEGVQSADSGEVFFLGKPRPADFKQRIGVVFQQTALPDFLTVKDCLSLFCGLYQSNPSSTQQWVDQLDMGELLPRFPKQLSGGQRQRVLLAIALLHDPDILFLDEPTTGLDPSIRQHFWSLIHHVKSLGKAIVLTTHDMHEAETLCEKIAVLNSGSIVAQGSPQQLLDSNFNETRIRLASSINVSQLNQFPYRVDISQGAPCFFTTNVEHSIELLRECGISLQGISIHPPTLEELYMTLTQEAS